MINEGEKRDNRIIGSAYRKKESGKPIPPGLAAARQAAIIRKKTRGKNMMEKDKAQIAAKRASSVQESFYSDLRSAAGGRDAAAQKVGDTVKAVGSLVGAFTSPRIVGKITDFLSNPKTVRRAAFGLRVAKRLGNTLLDLGNKPSQRSRSGSAMAYEPINLRDVRKSLATMGRQYKDAFTKYAAGRRASSTPSPFRSIPESFDSARQRRIDTARAMMKQLNEVSIGRRMKKAISKGKSPLVAAAKALAFNIKKRGVRGTYSPQDYIERQIYQLGGRNDDAARELRNDRYHAAREVAALKSAVLDKPVPAVHRPESYKSPDPLLRTLDAAKRILTAPLKPTDISDRPIGDALEQAYRETGGVSGVRDAGEMRDRLITFADDRWSRGTSLKDRLSFFNRARRPAPDQPAPQPVDIPPQETTMLDIAKGKLPGRGVEFPKK